MPSLLLDLTSKSHDDTDQSSSSSPGGRHHDKLNSYRASKLMMHLNCKLVDWKGRAVPNAETYKSPLVPVSPNPNFDDFEITIPAGNGLAGATYVRLAIYVGKHSENLGSVFIPISSFKATEQMLTIPVVRFKKMKVIENELQSTSGVAGLGELTVKVSKYDRQCSFNAKTQDSSSYIVR